MSMGETRKRILKVMDFPMSIGDVQLSARMKYDTAKEHLEWLFSMGVVHTSRDPRSGKLLYHKAEFAHPTLEFHLSIQEIEEKKKQGELPENAGRKEAEMEESKKRKSVIQQMREKMGEKTASDNEQPSLEDVPVRTYPEGEAEELESVIEEE